MENFVRTHKNNILTIFVTHIIVFVLLGIVAICACLNNPWGWLTGLLALFFSMALGFFLVPIFTLLGSLFYFLGHKSGILQHILLFICNIICYIGLPLLYVYFKIGENNPETAYMLTSIFGSIACVTFSLLFFVIMDIVLANIKKNR